MLLLLLLLLCNDDDDDWGLPRCECWDVVDESGDDRHNTSHRR